MTAIEYKGYQIEVGCVGKGWRASIFAPGSSRPLPDSPSNLEKSTEKEIIAEAKRIIDTLVSSQSESWWNAGHGSYPTDILLAPVRF